MGITQKQIAAQLGVSRPLVTRALRGDLEVSEETRKRIQAVAKKAGYRPNPFSRALAQKRTQILSAWLPTIYSAYYVRVVREMSRVVNAAGFELVVSDPHSMATSRSGVIAASLPVDGILVVDAPWLAQEYLRAHGESSLPCVTLGSYCSEETDSVRVDLFGASVGAVQQLIQLGFRRIAHMTTSVVERQVGEARRYAYETSLKNAGLSAEFIITPDGERATARRVVQDHVSAHGYPEAIFCHSDDIAIGAYRGLLDAGLRVPEDVSLIGCDGIEDADYLEVPLSTIAQPVREMCAGAWKFLNHRMDHPDAPDQRLVLQANFSMRQSTGSKFSAVKHQQ